MKLVQEFKEFAIKGNVVDMAVGIIIGAAFGKIVSSLVQDVVTPPIGILVGGVDFSNLSLTLKEAQGGVAAVTLNYGAFLQTVFNFLIVAFAIFLLVKGMNSMRRQQEVPEPAPATPPQEVVLLTEIRDCLVKQQGKS
ncbi:MAG: large-conductance mechanosensitive channel protein MscL [Bdellovibrionales bacterium]|nr:large-conductance mechanosensitive channel protein MscL [Bdellovibrionales bacterium]